MLNANNPAVNLATRRFLRSLRDGTEGLDEPCIKLMERALDRVRSVSPSGWVHLLASALGAEHEASLRAASAAELYYAMCSFTDDVQDGDAAEYMRVADQRILINTLAQMICVTAVRMSDVPGSAGDTDGMQQIRSAFLDGAAMLRGQRLEILREGWCVQRYREVASLSAGRQFQVYFRLACGAARVPPAPFLPICEPMGILVQVRHDEESRDDRLLTLPPEEVRRMVDSARAELEESSSRIPAEVGSVIREMVRYAIHR